MPRSHVLSLLLAAAGLAGCSSAEDPDAEPLCLCIDDRGPTTFYVRTDGDNGASGVSVDEAWRSIARANMGRVKGGDTLLFEAGSRFDGTLEIGLEGLTGGFPGQPLRIGSFGEGRAIIDAGDGDGIRIDNQSQIIIENLIIAGGWNAETQSGNDGEGINAFGTTTGKRRSGLEFRDLEVYGFKHAGIGIHAHPQGMLKDTGYDGVLIEDCEVHDNGDFGILTEGPYVYDQPGYSHANVTIRGTRAHHNRGLKNKGEHTGSGIVLSDVQKGLIEYSVAHDNGEFNDHDGGGGFGIWAWDSDQITIQFNESYDNKTSTDDGGGFDLDGGVTRSVMQFNYSHGNQGAGFGAFQFSYARRFSDNLIQYNISQNDGTAFLVWDGYGDMGSIAYAQNVGYGAKPALATYSALKDATFANNIFYGTGPKLLDVFDGSNLVLQGNAYWTGDAPFAIAWNTGGSEKQFSSFDEFRSTTGAETLEGKATGQHVDPQLSAAGDGPTLDDANELTSLTMYELQASSPLIDRGVDLKDLGIQAASRDFFGRDTPEGAARDVGAYEAR
jgi:Right handed beta helix region